MQRDGWREGSKIDLPLLPFPSGHRQIMMAIKYQNCPRGKDDIGGCRHEVQ